MKTYADKKTGSDMQPAANSKAAAGSALQLKDNRPQSIVQKKQAESLSNKQTIQKKDNKTGLPDQLKAGVENLSGYSMDDVKVHYNSAQPAQLNAHAYAQGTNIHVAPGQEKHLAHEAWHVVQQKQGRVKPTMQMKGKVAVNDDKGLEHEADVMGNRVMQNKQAALPAAKNANGNYPSDEIAQMVHNGNFRDIRGSSGYITLAVDRKNMGHTYLILETKDGAWMYHFRADAKNKFTSMVKLITWYGSFEEIKRNPVTARGKTPQQFVQGRGMNFHELKVKYTKVEQVKALCQGAVGSGVFSLILSNFGLGNNCFSKVYNILKAAGFAFNWSSYLLSFVSPRAALSYGSGFHDKKGQENSKYSYQ
jgi:hypothetical protein